MARIYSLSYLWCSKVHFFSWSRPHEFWERENWWVFVGNILPSWQVTYPLSRHSRRWFSAGGCNILSPFPEISKITRNWYHDFLTLTLFCVFLWLQSQCGVLLTIEKLPAEGFIPFIMLPGCKTLCDHTWRYHPSWATKKSLGHFPRNTGWLIGILIVVYFNPYTKGRIIPYIKKITRSFFIAQLVPVLNGPMVNTSPLGIRLFLFQWPFHGLWMGVTNDLDTN